MFFCAEGDVHEGSLQAFMLSELPAGVRRAAAGSTGKPMPVGLVRRDIIKAEVLVLHRRYRCGTDYGQRHARESGSVGPPPHCQSLSHARMLRADGLDAGLPLAVLHVWIHERRPVEAPRRCTIV